MEGSTTTDRVGVGAAPCHQATNRLREGHRCRTPQRSSCPACVRRSTRTHHPHRTAPRQRLHLEPSRSPHHQSSPPQEVEGEYRGDGTSEKRGYRRQSAGKAQSPRHHPNRPKDRRTSGSPREAQTPDASEVVAQRLRDHLRGNQRLQGLRQEAEQPRTQPLPAHRARSPQTGTSQPGQIRCSRRLDRIGATRGATLPTASEPAEGGPKTNTRHRSSPDSKPGPCRGWRRTRPRSARTPEMLPMMMPSGRTSDSTDPEKLARALSPSSKSISAKTTLAFSTSCTSVPIARPLREAMSGREPSKRWNAHAHAQSPALADVPLQI